MDKPTQEDLATSTATSDTRGTPWDPGTRSYVSGLTIVVWDAATREGGRSVFDYLRLSTDERGRDVLELPPFGDGTPCRRNICEHCHELTQVMHVRPHTLLPGKRWLCAACCPAEAFPR